MISDYFPGHPRHADKLAVIARIHRQPRAVSALVAMNTGELIDSPVSGLVVCTGSAWKIIACPVTS